MTALPELREPTPEERLEDPANQRTARALAVGMCRKRGLGWLEEDAEAVALAALWSAAVRYDPGRGEPWDKWLSYRVGLAVVDLMRREGKHGFTIDTLRKKVYPPAPYGADWQDDALYHPSAPDAGPVLAESREEAEAILARTLHVADLPAVVRDVIQARVLDELSGQATAERLGLTKGSVYVYSCQGLRRLRELLGPEGNAAAV